MADEINCFAADPPDHIVSFLDSSHISLGRLQDGRVQGIQQLGQILHLGKFIFSRLQVWGSFVCHGAHLVNKEGAVQPCSEGVVANNRQPVSPCLTLYTNFTLLSM